MSARRIAFEVHGRVQGVAFRAHARDAAARFGVTGFVLNRADGVVAGEAQGEEAALESFVGSLHRGSRWSRVERVSTVDCPTRDEESGFEVRR